MSQVQTYCFYCERAFHKLVPAIGYCTECGKSYCVDHGRAVVGRGMRRDPTDPDGKHCHTLCLQCIVQHHTDAVTQFVGNNKDHHWFSLAANHNDNEYFACYLCLSMQGKVVLTDRYCISCKQYVCEGVHGRFMPRPKGAVGGPFFCLSCSTKVD